MRLKLLAKRITLNKLANFQNTKIRQMINFEKSNNIYK